MGPEFFYYLIATIILSVLLAPKPVNPVAATLKDFEFPSAEEGTPQMVIFGDVWVTGWTVLTYGDLRSLPIELDDGAK
jgi:uncharacterized membrane protein